MILLVVKHVIHNISGKCGPKCCYVEFVVILHAPLIKQILFLPFGNYLFSHNPRNEKIELCLKRRLLTDNNSPMNFGKDI